MASSPETEEEVSSFAENGHTYSSEEIVKDPQGYLRDARQVHTREAHSYVAVEIARRATSYQRNTADFVARLLLRLAAFGVGVSCAVVLVGYLVTR